MYCVYECKSFSFTYIDYLKNVDSFSTGIKCIPCILEFISVPLKEKFRMFVYSI